MIVFRYLLTTLCALALSTTAASPEAWVNVERVDGVRVVVEDQVKDGCWPRPQATKDAVELIFRSAGILVLRNDEHFIATTPHGARGINFKNLLGYERAKDERFSIPHAFEMRALGSRRRTTEGQMLGCTVSLLVLLHRKEALRHYSDTAPVLYGEGKALLTGSNNDEQRRITELFVEEATSLANAILAKR